MRRKILSLLLGSTLAIAAVAPAAAATCDVGPGGAAALVALVNANVQANALCDVSVLNNSLNNLLQNADIHVLENILNHSPILNNWTITVSHNDILNQLEINVLSLGGIDLGGVTITGV